MYNIKEDAVIGLTIASVAVSEDKESLVMTLTDGRTATFETEGDCCSHSWVEHVTVPADIAGATIIAVKDGGAVQSFEQDYDEIAVYNTSFVTPKGEIIVEYRNASNGYYGGWMTGPYIR